MLKRYRGAPSDAERVQARHAIIIRGSSVRVRPPLLSAVPAGLHFLFPLATSGGPRSGRHIRGIPPPWGYAMRYIVMQAVAVGAAVALTACTEPRAPSAPPPSFAAVRPPAVFVVDASNGGSDTAAQDETPIAVNPADPDNILTGNNDFNLNDVCDYNVSFNGGKTCSPPLPNGFIPGLPKFTTTPPGPGTGSFDVAGDPSVGFSPDGRTAYFVCQAFNLTPPFQIALFASRSSDGRSEERRVGKECRSRWSPYH